MTAHEQRLSAEVIGRAWQDLAFREALVADPVAALRDAGLDVPAGTSVTVLENTPAVTHAVLPSDVSGSDAAADLAALVPLPAGHELHLHQNTEDQLFLVLPLPPGDELSTEELDLVVGGNLGIGAVGGNGGNGGTGTVLGIAGIAGIAGNGGAGGAGIF